MGDVPQFLKKEKYYHIFQKGLTKKHKNLGSYMLHLLYKTFEKSYEKLDEKTKEIVRKRPKEAVERVWKKLTERRIKTIRELTKGIEINEYSLLKPLVPWDPFSIEQPKKFLKKPPNTFNFQIKFEMDGFILYSPPTKRNLELSYPWINKNCLKHELEKPIIFLYIYNIKNGFIEGGIALLKKETNLLLFDINLRRLEVLKKPNRGKKAVEIMKALYEYSKAMELNLYFTPYIGGLSNDKVVEEEIMLMEKRKKRMRWVFGKNINHLPTEITEVFYLNK